MGEKIIMRNRKCSKSSGVSRVLALLKVAACVLCTTPSIEVGGSVINLANDVNSQAGSGSQEDPCLTPGCKNTASAILKNMDPNVDPCENFYQYACGGFLKTTIIPDDKSGVDIVSIIGDKLQEQLRTSIEAVNESNDLKPYRLVKKLYKSCMNTTAIEARGLKPLHAILKKLGGWPVADGDSWEDKDFEWINSTYKFRDVGYRFHSLISLGVEGDLKNNTKRVIVLDQPRLRLHRDFYMNGFSDEKISAYYSFMVDIAVMLGAEKARAMKELKDSLSFEMELAHISLPAEELRNATKSYNPMTLEDLTKNYPSIPWKEFISRLLPSSVTVEENEVVLVFVPSYIAAFEKLISQTPKRVQANYVMWNAVADSIPYLSNNIREKELVYETAVSGLTQHPPRWKECVGRVSSALGASIHAMYAQKYFNEDAKRNVGDIVKNIRKQIRRILKKADWMDVETRRKALKKVASMASYIAYPNELLDENKLQKHYENLELSEESYFENFLNRSLFSMELTFSKLREPFNTTDWLNHVGAVGVEAYYNPTENSIQLSAGILQGAIFSNDRPKYMNYGAIGTVVGHEITHGFDDLGSQFDKDGNLIDWWEPTTKENYLKRISCMIDQYTNYTVEEVQLNLKGLYTQSENIADNGGLKIAYHAYKNWARRNGPEQRLPGINRSPKQMFWISFANMMCSKTRSETLKTRIIEDNHSHQEFRVIGPLSNMPEFAKDFKCPPGSKMNPEKKCSVW